MKNKILIISSEFPPGPGGIGQHAYSLIKAFINEGYRIHLLSSGDYASKVDIDNFDRLQPFEIKRYSQSKGMVSYIHRIILTITEIRKCNFNNVILTGKFSIWQGLIIKIIFPKIRTFAVLHGSEVNLGNWLLKYLTHFSISFADVIIPVSEFTKSLLPNWIKFSNRKILVIPNGIELQSVTNVIESQLKLEGYPKLLTVGHVSPRKGQHRVIKALPELLKAWPNLIYHIVGRPVFQSDLVELAKSLNVDNHIVFHGIVQDYNTLSSYYKQSDVFMLLSENQRNGDVEGFGIVALEANYYGVPVVGAKYCGVEEAVDHMHSGFLVDGDNVDEILEGVKFCLKYKNSIRMNTVNWVQKHNWEIIIKKYKGLIS